ncbi:MAG: protein kinase [Pyrinomonadaceae bacterium]|nr:protein kinase [Pyrinomonadaceae bacterium]
MKDLVLQNCRLDGRYDVGERLGRGSYAEIFLATDSLASSESSHKTVVIKALNVFLQNDLDLDLERTLVENFQNEAIALDRVRHPNILSRLGHGSAKDLRGTVFHYLVVEYLPGGDLAKHCRSNKLSVKQALSYIEQVCAGLSNAHKHGIIHRDIKPQNILLTADKKIVKIADFGVARSDSSDSPITRVGTNIYAPPEHSPLLAGQTGLLEFSKLTPAADVYSLAKTAYVLFTGESPRFSANQPLTELPHAMRPLPWADKLVEVLSKATATDSRDRYQDVSEFWRELSEIGTMDVSAEAAGIPIESGIRQSFSTTPKAQIAKGFTPMAPVKPAFDTSKNLKLKEVAPTTRLDSAQIKHPLPSRKEPKAMPQIPMPPSEPIAEQVDDSPLKKPRRRRSLRAFGILAILLVVFAGSLFATYNYFLGNPLFSGFGRTATRSGTATTDINLRPGPTTANRPIGLVTKNSRVRILRTSNNWHEVVIIQHGRPQNNGSRPDKGWVYGSYIAEE